MKIQSRILSIIIAAAMAAASLPLTAFAADTSETENLILFGSYPQSEVKDENLLSSLNGIATEWTSYDYYSGTGIYDDGKMSASDFMKYADVELGGSKYRGVVFDEYRPTFTGYSLTNDTDTYQDNNGYECGKTYWFKFEPLRWRVINPENGYVICDSIIDSQPFSNFLYFNGSAYYMDTLGYDFSNYYVNSSIRSWLNADFADTAFSPEEKENIVTNYMDDFWKDIYDKVFLPSANEMKITGHWKDDASKIAAGTDYAKCQGLFVSEGISYWRLRSPSDWSHAACALAMTAALSNNNYDFSDSFIISVGCAGGSAGVTTLGDIVLVTGACDNELGHTADIREFDNKDSKSTWFPDSSYDATSSKLFSPELAQQVFNMIKDVKPNTTEISKNVLKSNFKNEEWALRSPMVIKGTALSGDSFWKGETGHNNALKIIENYKMPDPYAVTEMEELTVANAAECFGLLDRVISLRAVVDLDVFLGNDSPESLWSDSEGYNNNLGSESSTALDIFEPAMRSLFDVSEAVIDAVLEGKLSVNR